MIISVYNIKRSGKSIYVEFTANEKDFSILESGYAKGKYVLASDIKWDKDEFSDEENDIIQSFLDEQENNEDVTESLCETAKFLAK